MSDVVLENKVLVSRCLDVDGKVFRISRILLPNQFICHVNYYRVTQKSKLLILCGDVDEN